MRYKVNLIGPAAGIDWAVFRKEGDSYLRRLGVSDQIAVWLGAKLYLINWKRWQLGRQWHEGRARWERPGPSKRVGAVKPDAWRASAAVSWARNNNLLEPAWTADLEGALLAHRAQGLSYREIAKQMGKTKAAIQARVRYLSLGRRL